MRTETALEALNEAIGMILLTGREHPLSFAPSGQAGLTLLVEIEAVEVSFHEQRAKILCGERASVPAECVIEAERLVTNVRRLLAHAVREIRLGVGLKRTVHG